VELKCIEIMKFVCVCACVCACVRACVCVCELSQAMKFLPHGMMD